MKTFIADIECWEPLFMVGLLDIDTKKKYIIEFHEYLTNAEYNRNRALLKTLMEQNCIFWWYNKRYDQNMLKMAKYLDYNFNKYGLKLMKDFSDVIININDWQYCYKTLPGLQDFDPKLSLYPTQHKCIMKLHRLMKSLKAVGINLEMPVIEELPFDHYKQHFTKEEIEKAKEYLKNDLVTTYALYRSKETTTELNARRLFAQLYPESYEGQFDSMSRSALSKYVLSTWFSETGIKDETLQYFIHKRHSVAYSGSDFIFQYNFQTDEGKAVEAAMRAFIFDFSSNKRKSFRKSIKFNDITWTFAEGGIHTKDDPMMLRDKENRYLTYVDVGAYYPTLIVNHDLVSPMLMSLLPKIKEVVATRFETKRKKLDIDIVLKIIINAITGLLGDSTSILYDKPSHLKMLLNGQLGMFDLAERLTLKGCKVWSANTDGMCITSGSLDLVQDILKEWENDHKAKLDIDPLKVFACSATNNYMFVPKEGKTKAVGIFNQYPNITQSGGLRIISKALYEYFQNNVPIEQTIIEERNPHYYVLTQSVNKKFKVKYGSRDVGNVLRWFWGTTTKEMQYTKYEGGVDKGRISRSQGASQAEILYDKPNTIDYKKYIAEVNSILEPILKNEL